MKRILRRIGTGLLYLAAAIALLLLFSLRWAVTTWSDLKMEELIFELQAPLTGTGNGMIRDYLVQAALPAAVGMVLLICLASRIGKKHAAASRLVVLLAAVLALGITVLQADRQVGLGEWLSGETHGSSFVEEHYADPARTQITFPEKKRNLVYIYLESMELTFADEAHGGAFQENLIPELVELAEENEDFSGNAGLLNGGIALPGTTWTMGAMFGTTSGLPLKISIGANSMSSQNAFFPAIKTMGDILEEEGYAQTLLIGSEAAFGGRELYFTGHGHYAIEDYVYAAETGLIPRGYKVFWGYEDKRLFSFARDSLSRLAEGEEPFNFTMLTVDTHFEDGYVCDLCGDAFGENQYANVYACSSRQVAEFVRWIQAQPFYDNTTIVITGDHPTMDRDFCDDVPEDYQRKTYTCYLNAAQKAADPDRVRVFSTFDHFPTTLAALGATIEGERLGLGTNLFSDRDTLTEEFGLETEQKELKRKSALLSRLEAVDEHAFEKMVGATVDCSYVEETEELHVHLRDIRGLTAPFDRARATLASGTSVSAETEVISGDNTCDLLLHASPGDVIEGTLTVTIADREGREEAVLQEQPYPLLHTERFADYLQGVLTMRRHGNYTLLLSVRDDGATNFTEAMQAAFSELGLRADFLSEEAYRQSYLAVVGSGSAYEEMGAERLTWQGILPGGQTAEMVSGGHEAGSASSILIDGDEFSLNRRGFNLVLYDDAAGRTIERNRFDLYRTSYGLYTCTLERGGRLQQLGRIHVRVSEISLSEKLRGRTLVAYWYEDRPEEIKTVELQEGSAGDYVGTLQGRMLAGVPLHMAVYLVNSRGVWYPLGEM